MKKNIYLLAFLFILLNSCSSENDDEASCPQVSNLNFSAQATDLYIYFNPPNGVNSFEIEYGISGFTYGSGMKITTSSSDYTIPNLIPSTTYDVYVSSICSANEKSAPVSYLSLTTTESLCQTIPTLTAGQIFYNEISVSFSTNGASFVESYELEYGLAGFTLGTGTTLTNNSSGIDILNFQPDTTYDIYGRVKCNGSDYSQYSLIQYRTLESCPAPYSLNATFTGGSCSTLSAGYNFSWQYPFGLNPINYEISIVSLGGTPTGASFTTSNQAIGITNFSCADRDFYVRARCADGTLSDWGGPFTF
jgi:hypothetical protein